MRLNRTRTPSSRTARPERPAVQRLEGRVLFAASDLDPTFSGDGVARFDYQDADFPGDVAVQADGKVVVVGSTDRANSAGEDFLVVRFNADGSLDSTFGGGDGFVVTDFGGGRDDAAAVEILPDGRILVAGGTESDTNGPPYGQFAVARYTPGGAPDTTFGGDGELAFDMRGMAYDVKLQPDGKAVLAGQGEYSNFGLARVNANGTLDTTFGTGGKVFTDFNQRAEYATAVALAPGGKIVAVGPATGGNNRGVIARYTADGRIDTSFSGDGKFWIEDPNPILTGVVVQPDGKIVVVDWDYTLRRIRAGGGYDLTFGRGGVGGADVTDDERDFAHATDLDRQADGKLVVTGQVVRPNGTGSQTVSKVARFSPNGILDTTFGDGGVASVAAADEGFGPVLYFSDLAPDGKIVSVGRHATKLPGDFNSDIDFTVYRLQADGPGQPPPTGGGTTVQGEQADGPQDGWVVGRSHAGYTGSGYLDFTADSGASATWNFNDLPGAGDYVIDFRYANGSARTRTLGLEAFPGNNRTVAFAPTGGWAAWRSVSVPVTLGGSGNALKVTLSTLGSNGPNIDSITVRRVDAPPPSRTELQAEAARLSGPRVSRSNTGYTGGGYADYGDAAGQYIEWTFTQAQSGARTVTFRYANGGSDRPLELSVNGNAAGRVSFPPTGAWSAWREVSLTVQLASGTNTLRLTSVGSGPNIDRVTVGSVP